MRTTLAILLLSAGCRSTGHTDVSKTIDDAGVSVSTLAQDASVAVVDGGRAADFTRDYRGTLGAKTAIEMHLSRRGASVHGSYVYVSMGADIQLDGSATDAAIVLTERVKTKETGMFSLHTDDQGVLAGTWSDPQRSKTYPVTLSPFDPSAAPSRSYVIMKRTAENEACRRHIEYLEIRGLANPGVQAELNKKLGPAGDINAPCTCDPASMGGCGYESTAEMHVNKDGILAATSFEFLHPGRSQSTFNIVLATGHELSFDEIVLPTKRAAFFALVRPKIDEFLAQMAGIDSNSVGLARGMLEDLPKGTVQFVLEPTGIRLLPGAYPSSGMEFDEGVLAEFDRVRSTLDPASPAAKLWKH